MPAWYRPLLLSLAAMLLIGWFSPAISDPDFWWHLKTGQFIVRQHGLPVPDPFAYTTYMGSPAYPGEPYTSHFNLTHEWLAQVMLYAAYAVGGFAGVVLARALTLTAACALVGLVAYRRTRGFYRSVGAAVACAGVMQAFAADRPFVITFLFLAGTIAILEWGGKLLWLLPPVMLVWANCHGGYFLGWVVLGAYAVEALRARKMQAPAVCAAAVLVSGFNPNGFRIPQILSFYRNSYLTSRLLEWAPTVWWPPHWYTLLALAAVAVAVWARRRVRLVDWLLLGAFLMAAFTAYRNVVLVGIVAPIVIVSYLPEWKRGSAAALQYGAAAGVVAGLMAGILGGNFFQFRANEWKWPSGAADFLLAHHITQPIFNTYEYGGYLMWRLWPGERVFIDGRSLNESVFLDYTRILYNHDESGGKSASQLLDRYGVQAIVMNGFEYVTGNVYLLAPALADPQQSEWKLVYSDPEALVFLRHPAADLPAMSSLDVLNHLEQECELHLEREPQYPRCARSLGQVFSRVGQFVRARRWIGRYLELWHEPDREAEDAYRRMLGVGEGSELH